MITSTCNLIIKLMLHVQNDGIIWFVIDTFNITVKLDHCCVMLLCRILIIFMAPSNVQGMPKSNPYNLLLITQWFSIMLQNFVRLLNIYIDVCLPSFIWLRITVQKLHTIQCCSLKIFSVLSGFMRKCFFIFLTETWYHLNIAVT